MVWDGEDCQHPATGLLVQAGEHEYPDEHAEALMALGLKPVEPAAPAPRKRTKGGEE
jgi:hypothetical protein